MQADKLRAWEECVSRLLIVAGAVSPSRNAAGEEAYVTYSQALHRLLALAGVVAPAAAQDYPAQTVKIIVPFGAGGPADIYARFLGQQLQETLKQTFVIENRPGAGAVIGTGEVAKSAPDGYTLLMMSNTHTTNETLLPNKPFQLMRDFVPVAPVNYSDLIMVVHPSVPAKDLKEFLALLKGKPGDLNYASSGPGTPYHMAGELFKAMSGTSIVHVPHRGSGDARTAVIGGHVQMMIDAITTTAPTVQAGQVRALGTTGLKALDRAARRADHRRGGAAGLRGHHLARHHGADGHARCRSSTSSTARSTRCSGEPETKEAWAKQGAEPLVMTPAEFDKYLRGDIDKWAKVIQTAGIKVQ